MNQNTYTEKIPGGKLVRMKVEFNDAIHKIEITGDFFLHPEETIEKLEHALVGVTVHQDPQIIKSIIETVLENNNAEFVGVTPDDLVRMLKSAVKIE